MKILGPERRGRRDGIGMMTLMVVYGVSIETLAARLVRLALQQFGSLARTRQHITTLGQALILAQARLTLRLDATIVS